jgi:hypothetical protein
VTDLFTPYDAASKTAEGPSNDAGAMVRPKVKDTNARIMALLASVPSGLTPDEIADRLGIPLWTARPRCSELKAGGHIVDAGVRRRNRSGAKAGVVRIKTEGQP